MLVENRIHFVSSRFRERGIAPTQFPQAFCLVLEGRLGVSPSMYLDPNLVFAGVERRGVRDEEGEIRLPSQGEERRDSGREFLTWRSPLALMTGKVVNVVDPSHRVGRTLLAGFDRR